MLLNNLTVDAQPGYAIRSAPHWAGGFGHSHIPGAKASRRQVRGFFYALSSVMAGGVWGGREACRILDPVDQPDTSSAALSLVTPVGGLKLQSRSSIMNTHSQIAPNALQISDIAIRQDPEGRYCLNDLHKASGNNPKHQPRHWLSSKQAQDLISELEKDDRGIPLSKIQGRGKEQGTYAVKELVYAYGMWISASFSLKVIRAYDALQSQPPINQGPLPQPRSIESFRTRILVTLENGKTTQDIVPFGCCIVDPESELSLRTVIRECVPVELLPVVIDSANQRMMNKFKTKHVL